MTTGTVSDEWWAGFHLGQADKEADRYSLVGGDTQAAHDRAEGYAVGRGLAAAHARAIGKAGHTHVWASREQDREAGS